MRVAVLADIHGNLPALDAVLTEVAAARVDRVVLLGDIALGPLPAETLDRLAGLGEGAVWVHGNCEREVVSAYDGRHRDLLADLPMTVRLELDGLGPALFCHATATARRRVRAGRRLTTAVGGGTRWSEGADRRLRAHAHALRPAR
ncbi:MAG: metallophosphoesterase family protein [Mycobacteriales bacterium]